MSPEQRLTLNLRAEGASGCGVGQAEWAWEGDLRWEREGAGRNVVGNRGASKRAWILHYE